MRMERMALKAINEGGTTEVKPFVLRGGRFFAVLSCLSAEDEEVKPWADRNGWS